MVRRVSAAYTRPALVCPGICAGALRQAATPALPSTTRARTRPPSSQLIAALIAERLAPVLGRRGPAGAALGAGCAAAGVTAWMVIRGAALAGAAAAGAAPGRWAWGAAAGAGAAAEALAGAAGAGADVLGAALTGAAGADAGLAG